ASPSAPPPPPPAQAAPAAPAPASPTPSPAGTISLNQGSFEQFRSLGMSITQAKRVVARRDDGPGFSSVDDLDTIPGFSQGFLLELKQRLTV
ncbi:MAG: ComEA family DNA-binding protein, partial [Solirubrobacterales bacterium]